MAPALSFCPHCGCNTTNVNGNGNPTVTDPFMLICVDTPGASRSNASLERRLLGSEIRSVRPLGWMAAAGHDAV